MPNTNWWQDPNFKPFTGFDSTGRQVGSTLTSAASTPAYDRVSSIPSWLPAFDTHELTDQLKGLGDQFSSSDFDAASKGQESRVLTTGLNAGNNAAADYANRARQAGGSGMGAGLVKAESSVAARKSAGEIALDRAKFDASQREKAAGLASQIANTLGTLRDSYLKSIVQYATSEDDVSARFAAVDASNKATDESARQFNWRLPGGGGYTTDRPGNISELYGLPFRDPVSGMPSNDIKFAPTNRGMRI